MIKVLLKIFGRKTLTIHKNYCSFCGKETEGEVCDKCLDEVFGEECLYE